MTMMMLTMMMMTMTMMEQGYDAVAVL